MAVAPEFSPLPRRKLGAGTVVGVDIDPQALAAARANSRANEVDASYTDLDGLSQSTITFDVVLANILSNPLKLLAPALAARVAPRGSLVLSGVLERQADEVIASYRCADASFDLNVWRSQMTAGSVWWDLVSHGAGNQVPSVRRLVSSRRRPTETARGPRPLRPVSRGIRCHRQPDLRRRHCIGADPHNNGPHSTTGQTGSGRDSSQLSHRTRARGCTCTSTIINT